MSLYCIILLNLTPVRACVGILCPIYIVDISGTLSSSLKLSYGVVQGSILGPILFLVFINDIFEVEELDKMFLYADDTTLYCEAPDGLTAVRLANNFSQRVESWLSSNRVSVNISKCKCIFFNVKPKF